MNTKKTSANKSFFKNRSDNVITTMCRHQQQVGPGKSLNLLKSLIKKIYDAIKA